MTGRRAGLALVAMLFLAGCAASIPDSGRQAGAGQNYKYDTPAFFTASIGDMVNFAVDQSTLSPEAMSILDAQAKWLIDNPRYTAVIEGHADERGTREYNLALGARRASAVKTYLVSKGVDARRLRTVSYGKERPLELCSAESCWAKNRRAVTVVSAPGSS